MNPGLLEQISLQCGCLYVSQLHSVSLYRFRYVLGHISPDRYELWEWCDAVRYITGQNFTFPTPEDAAAFLYKYTINLLT